MNRSSAVLLAVLWVGCGSTNPVVDGGSGGGATGGGTTGGGSGTTGGGSATDCQPGATRACYRLDGGTPGEGLCAEGTELCGVNGSWAGACLGQTGPVTEICNGEDDDCDGQTDEDLGSSSCGVGPCQRTTLNCMSGAPQTCMPAPAGSEQCNGIDDDCNGVVDDGNPATLCPPGTSVTSTTCASATCSISACAPDTFDVDGSYSSGCECANTGGASTCASATSLGALGAPPSTVSRTGNIPAAGTSDSFAVTVAPSPTTDTPQISVNTGFTLEVLNGSCAGAPLPCNGGGTATGITQLRMNSAAVGGAGSCITSGSYSTLFIRVQRSSAGISCAPYTLTLSR